MPPPPPLCHSQHARADPFIHVAYGWLNELKNLGAAFKDDRSVSDAIKPFYLIATSCSLGLMVLLGWLPVGAWILTNITGVDPALVARCIGPMRLFTLWPPAVALRSYCQGMALRERRTEALAPAGPLRVVAIACTLQFFSTLGAACRCFSCAPAPDADGATAYWCVVWGAGTCNYRPI